MRLPLLMNRGYRWAAERVPETVKPTLRGWYNAANKFATYGHIDIFTALDIEINARCNISCSYCPSGDMPRGDHHMPAERWKKVLDDLSAIPYSGRISPHFFGEPLLSPQLPEFVRYARASNPQSQIVIHTNGTKLTRESFRELVDAGVTGFLITKHLPNWPRPLLEIVRDDTDAKKYIRMRTMEKLALFNRGGTVSPVIERRMKTCHYISDEIAVTYKGEVVCTNDFHIEEPFGNVQNTSLLDIWHSEEFTTMRRRVRGGKFDLAVCQRCALGVGLEKAPSELVNIKAA